MNITNIIQNFANFLNICWTAATPVLENRQDKAEETALHDWLQANWELLVEQPCLDIEHYLEVYGEGADIGDSSRVSYPYKLPTHYVGISSENEIKNHLTEEYLKLDKNKASFYSLVSFSDGYYHNTPPFNYVLLEDEHQKEVVVKISDVSFFALPLS